MNATECKSEVSESKDTRKQKREERLEFHPLALIFPEMVGEPFDKLIASIRESGQREPVLVADGKIADGRNRARAVWKLQDEGVEIELMTLGWDDTTGRSLADEVWVRNAVRRQLTGDQMAMAVLAYRDAVGEECERRQQASRFKKAVALEKPVNPISDPPLVASVSGDKNARSHRGQLAVMAKVSRHKMDRAIKVKKEGAPQLVEAVQKGELTLANACRQMSSRNVGRAEPGNQIAKEKPSTMELAKRAWTKLKDQVGCADAPALRTAMRKVIQDDEEAHGGGKKTVGKSPVGEEKRGRGRPPKPR